MTSQFLRTVASRTATAVGAAVIATVVVAGSLSVAQATMELAANNSVNSASIVNNSVQGIDIKDGTVAAADLATAVRPRWAKVNAGLTTALISGRGAVSATRVGVGLYQVSFAAAITGCGWTATLNDNDNNIASPGEIAVERSANAFRLWVSTYNSAGTLTDTAEDHGFTLAVHC